MKAAVVGQDIAPDTRGARLRRLRKSRGLTLESVAAMVGVNASFIGLIEKDANAPGREFIFRLSDFYGVSVHFIERGREFSYSDCFGAVNLGPSPEVHP